MKRLLAAALGALAATTMTPFATAASATIAAAPTTVAYDSIQSPVPGNVQSWGYEATQTNETGDKIDLVGAGSSKLNSVDVVMSSWGCESGSISTNDCTTTPGATFDEPITLNIYKAGAGDAVGSVLASVTQTFAIPYRPSHDTVNCTGDRWYDTASSTCFNGLANVITFDTSSLDLVLPSTVIYGIAYNTSHYGYAPYGDAAACRTEDGGCGYDSLNLGFADSSPTTGTDVDPDSGYMSGAGAYPYCDGGAGGLNTFRADNGCYAGSTYAVRFNLAPTSSSTVTVSPSDMHGWEFQQEDTPTGSGQMVFGPGTPPAGDGSAQLTVDGTGRENIVAAIGQGTRFSQLTALGYSTFSNDATLAPSFQMNVDYDLSDGSTGWQGRLVYEPYQNGTVTPGAWQTWDVLGGKLWATNATGQGVCPQSNPCTVAQLLAAFPNAGIHATLGAVLVRAGQWSAGFTGNTDAVTLGVLGNTTTYDFEPDPLPVVSATSPSIVEGNSSAKPLTFTVSLDKASTQTITVDYATVDGTAADGSDYAARSGSLSFAAGETSKTVSVPVIGDKTAENDETFTLDLSNATNATLGSDGTGTILNDDIIKLKVVDAQVLEGNTGVKQMTFKVQASQVVPSDVTFDYTTNDGTAFAPGDYATTSGTTTIATGTKVITVKVPIKGDKVAESTETFSFDISNVHGAAVQDGSGTGTIVDND